MSRSKMNALGESLRLGGGVKKIRTLGKESLPRHFVRENYR